MPWIHKSYRERSCSGGKEGGKGVRARSADLFPYLLENKRGLAFPGAQRHRLLLSLLNQPQSGAEQENYSHGGSEGAERNNPDYAESILI